MAGKRSRQLKSSSEKAVKRQRVSRRSAEKAELDLPTEILELILSQLSTTDRARAAAVCRKWREVAEPLQKFNKPPILLHIPKRNDTLFPFCDMSRCGASSITLLNRPHGIVSYAKDGWMLFFNAADQHMTFFSLATQESVKLPKLEFGFKGAAFSAPPTSPNCIVFAMHSSIRYNYVQIMTCRPRDTEWTLISYQNEPPLVCIFWNLVVVCNGAFYCLDISGRIGVYSPQQSTWRVVNVQPLKCMATLNVDDWGKRLFMAEHYGDIFLLRTCGVVRPVVYKLDEIKNEWVKVKDLGGATFFANFTTSLIRDELSGIMRNCIYFSKVVFKGMYCVTYNLRHKRFYTETQKFDPGELQYYENVWIDGLKPLKSSRQLHVLHSNPIRTYQRIRWNAFRMSS